MQTRTPLPLAKFLRKFPCNAKSWSKATDELPELLEWINGDINGLSHVSDVCIPSQKHKTPAEWNRNYRRAIRLGFAKLTAGSPAEFLECFQEWFE